MIDLVFDDSPLAADPILRRHRGLRPPRFAPPPGGIRDDVLDSARRGWTDRARAEYIGVMVARKLHGLLIDLNAPLDLQGLALVMTLQEHRHAELCVAAARALGEGRDGRLDLAFDLDELQQARSAESIEAQTLRMIVGTYAIGEVVALDLIKATLRRLPASPWRDVLRLIARDEVLHARVGPLLIESMRRGETASWLPWPGEARIIALAAEQIEVMRARDVVEPEDVALGDDAIATAQLAALGLTPAAEFKRNYLDSLNKIEIKLRRSARR